MIRSKQWLLSLLTILLPNASVLACGGIHSMSAVKKDKVEIFGIGDLHCDDKVSEVSIVDKHDHEAFELLLHLLPPERKETAFLTLMPVEYCKMATANHRRNKYKSDYYESLRSKLARLAFEQNYKFGSVTFLTTPALKTLESAYITYITLFFSGSEFIEMAHLCRLPPLSNPATLERLLATEPQFKRPFLGVPVDLRESRNIL